MLNFFKQIKENGNSYIISGFPVKTFTMKLQKFYNTTRLAHLFEAIGFRFWNRNTIRVHKFFIPELIYLLTKFNYPKRLIDEIFYSTWVGDAANKTYHNRFDIKRVYDEMNCTPLPYQLEFVENYDILRQTARLNGALLSFDQGLGKTLSSLMLMIGLNIEKVIIIAPKSLLETVWVYHIKTFFNKKKKIFVVGKDAVHVDYDYFIVNYESMDKLEPILGNLGDSVGVIVDESHNFLRMASERTNKLIDIRRKTGTVDMLLMSGTPLKNAGVEIIPLLLTIDNYFDKDAVVVFKKAFGLNTNIGTDILKTRLQSMMYRKLKTEVVSLPEKYESVVKIKIPNGSDYTAATIKKEVAEFIQVRMKYHTDRMESYKRDFYTVIDYLKHSSRFKADKRFEFYLDTVEDFNSRTVSLMSLNDRELIQSVNTYEKESIIPVLPTDMKKLFNNCKAAFKYVNLKVQGEVIGQLFTRKRIQMTNDMLKHSDITQYVDESIKKTVIFTSYVDTIEITYDYFNRKGYHAIPVYGKTAADAASHVHEFQTNHKINPLIASLSMLSTGVTLTAANTLIFLNRPFRYHEYLQASDRIHRIGADTDCFIITFELDTGREPNLSTNMADILTDSKQFFEDVVGLD